MNYSINAHAEILDSDIIMMSIGDIIDILFDNLKQQMKEYEQYYMRAKFNLEVVIVQKNPLFEFGKKIMQIINSEADIKIFWNSIEQLYNLYKESFMLDKQCCDKKISYEIHNKMQAKISHAIYRLTNEITNVFVNVRNSQYRIEVA